MKIQPITAYNLAISTDNNINRSNYSTNNIRKYDSVTFGNTYSGIIKDLASTDLKNLTMVRDGFDKLMVEIMTNSEIEKNKYFGYIEKLYKKGGYTGLLHELWKPHPVREVVNLMKKTTTKELILAQKDGKPILMLYNPGSFDLSSTNNTKKARELILSFQTPSDDALVTFNLNKKGNYVMDKRVNEIHRRIEYYASTWNKKREVVNGLGPQETTYYNEDGSRSFWKNWLFGGPAV